MRLDRAEPLSPELESLLAHKRGVRPANSDLRRRALARANRSVAETASAGRRVLQLPLRDRHRWFFLIAATAAAGTALVATVRSPKGPAPTGSAHRAALEAAPPTSMPATPPPRPIGAPVVPDEPTQAVSPSSVPQNPHPPGASASQEASVGAVSRESAYDIELRLLGPAHDAVARHDFGGALSSLDEHRRRFATGKLAEERDALRIRAMVGLGQHDQARRAASAFRGDYPNSVLLPLVERVLRGGP